MRTVNITGKFFGAVIGWVLGRFEGAAFGFLVGALYDMYANPGRGNDKGPGANTGNTAFDSSMSDSPINMDYILVSLSAAIMRSDGTTTRSELDYVRNFFLRQFGMERTKQDLLMLREALKQSIPLDRVCNMARAKMNYQTRVQVLHYLFGVACADGRFSSQEQSVLNRIAIYLRISPTDYNTIFSMYGGARAARPVNNSTYETLGIARNATEEEIKKAYRQMALKYHPDRVTHLGEDARKTAEEKFKEIQEAYEAIKKDKGFS